MKDELKIQNILIKDNKDTKTKNKLDKIAIGISIIALLISIGVLLLQYQNNKTQIQGNVINENLQKINEKDLLMNEAEVLLSYHTKIIDYQEEKCLLINESDNNDLITNNLLFKNATLFFFKGEYNLSINYAKQINPFISCYDGLFPDLFVTGNSIKNVNESKWSIGLIILAIIIITIIMTIKKRKMKNEIQMWQIK